MKKFTIFFSLHFLLLLPGLCFAAPGEPYSDEWLEGRIKGALDFNSYFDSTDVSIDVNKGVATLTGKVPSETESSYAESLASRFEGVRQVKNQLTIDESISGRNRSAISQSLYDTTTTAIVRSRLGAYKSTAPYKINVDTKNNIVTLQGAVPSGDAKDQAEKIALATSGVIDVDNQLKIENPQSMGDKVENSMVDASNAVSDIWISTKVRSLLAFSSDYPGSSVKVTTNQGKVTLEGYARSTAQKAHIVEDVNGVVGVKFVEDKLTVK